MCVVDVEREGGRQCWGREGGKEREGNETRQVEEEE